MFGKPTHETQIYDNNTYQKGAVYLGQVKEVTEDGYVVFYQKNKFRVGDTIEIMKKNGENQTVSVLQMLNEDGEETDACPHPGEKIRMRVDGVVCAGEIMRGIER